MLVCVFLCSLHTRPRVQRAPGLPCALCFRRNEITATPRARLAPRECGVMFLQELATVIASEAKQSISLAARRKNGLLRFARNDAGRAGPFREARHLRNQPALFTGTQISSPPLRSKWRTTLSLFQLRPGLSSSPPHTGLDESRQAAAGIIGEAHLEAFLPTSRKPGGAGRVALDTGHFGFSGRHCAAVLRKRGR